ncbi:hypothetical protein J6590_097319 [Homalodisca vitripennis]|nr:hypothetical protein J6590_097319 [Homalodisca vitripennis]
MPMPSVLRCREVIYTSTEQEAGTTCEFNNREHVSFEHMSSRVDVKLINRLPDGVKQANSLKHVMVSKPPLGTMPATAAHLRFEATVE